MAEQHGFLPKGTNEVSNGVVGIFKFVITIWSFFQQDHETKGGLEEEDNEVCENSCKREKLMNEAFLTKGYFMLSMLDEMTPSTSGNSSASNPVPSTSRGQQVRASGSLLPDSNRPSTSRDGNIAASTPLTVETEDYANDANSILENPGRDPESLRNWLLRPIPNEQEPPNSSETPPQGSSNVSRLLK